MSQTFGGYQPTNIPDDDDFFDPFDFNPVNQDAEASAVEITISPAQKTVIVKGRLHAAPPEPVAERQPLGELVVDAFAFAIRVVFTCISIGFLSWVVFSFFKGAL